MLVFSLQKSVFLFSESSRLGGSFSLKIGVRNPPVLSQTGMSFDLELLEKWFQLIPQELILLDYGLRSFAQGIFDYLITAGLKSEQIVIELHNLESNSKAYFKGGMMTFSKLIPCKWKTNLKSEFYFSNIEIETIEPFDELCEPLSIEFDELNESSVQTAVQKKIKGHPLFKVERWKLLREGLALSS